MCVAPPLPDDGDLLPESDQRVLWERNCGVCCG